MLGVDLGRVEVGGDLGGLGAEFGLKRVRKTVRRVGREDQCASPVGGASQRRSRGNRGLADPALAGVEDRARRQGAKRTAYGGPGPVPPVVDVPVGVVEVDVGVVVVVVPVGVGIGTVTIGGVPVVGWIA
jgi:hypothetical protein